MDTEYTKGFKAGLVWEQERIIKLLKKRRSEVRHSLDKIGAEAREYWQIKCRILEIDNAIELIKGETNE